MELDKDENNDENNDEVNDKRKRGPNKVLIEKFEKPWFWWIFEGNEIFQVVLSPSPCVKNYSRRNGNNI